MLFNSTQFIYFYLPVALLGFHLLGRYGRRAAIGWLAFMSIVFYSVWNPVFVLLLLASILVNFAFSRVIGKTASNPRQQHWSLILGIAANLGILCYFKYLFPLLGFLYKHGLTHSDWGQVILPLGISFFTFTQIAYLVDLKQGHAEPQSFLSYTLFVTFFPHLIAGPILHHKEIMPQFSEERRYGLNCEDFALGLTWFVMGLIKKVLVADRIAPRANLFYDAPSGVGTWMAWHGVLIYLMQLYFDFSGYSDMALGLARMFSVEFPVNFNSPYKARSIIDYWQRWHMTLSRYLTLYLYSPIVLAISRRRAKQGKRMGMKVLKTPGGFFSLLAMPTLITMFLAGVWHGAGVRFIVFGVLHGVFLCINHVWRTVVPRGSRMAKMISPPVGVALTFLSVAMASIFFRANSMKDALAVISGLCGRHGMGFHWGLADVILISGLFAFVWIFPNTQQILGQQEGAADETWNPFPNLRWRPNIGWAVALTAGFLLSLAYLNSGSTFLYFQF